MITKNYIKMCEKAEEIQKPLIPLWSFVIVKKCWATKKREIGIVTSFEKKYKRYNIFMKGNPYGTIEQNNLIWLPTQEQLQEMILPIFLKRFSTTHALRNDSSFIYRMVIEKFQRWVNRGSPSFDEYMAMFSSFNELWLAFVMKEKWNKKWDGKKWK